MYLIRLPVCIPDYTLMLILIGLGMAVVLRREGMASAGSSWAANRRLHICVHAIFRIKTFAVISGFRPRFFHTVSFHFRIYNIQNEP